MIITTWFKVKSKWIVWNAGTPGKTFGVNSIYRIILDISKEIYPTHQPNWISSKIPSKRGVIISVPIVVHASLTIIKLSRQPQIILNRLNFNRRFPK